MSTKDLLILILLTTVTGYVFGINDFNYCKL